MNHGCVTLDEVFAAASARAASLVPETSGYLALAIGDATSRLPLLHDDRALMLTTEGGMSASRRGDVVTPEKAAKAMRETLARLLAVSSGSMPGLAAAARPREESARGVDAVIEEIEAALIPVNRAAAQRALARLSRETLRAKEAGKLKPKREASVRPPPRPAAVAAPRVVFAEPAPEQAVFSEPARDQAVFSEPARVIFSEPAPEQAVFSEPPPLAPRVEAAIVEAKPIALEIKPIVVEAAPIVEPAPVVVEAAPVVVEAAAVVESAPVVVESAPVVVEAAPVVAEAEADVPYALPLVLDVALALSPVIEAETLVLAEQVVAVSSTPLHSAPVEALSPSDSRFETRDFSEPTPTTLGMAIEIDEEPTPLAAMEVVHATDLGPAVAVDTEPEPEPEPAAVIHARVVEMPVIPAPGLAPAPGPTTRADDLLATFAVSCSDAAAVREATDCLKKLAGLEPTPPPAAVAPPVPAAPPAPPAPARAARPTAPIAAAPRVARSVPAPAPLPVPVQKGRPALDALRDQLEEQGRSPRKRGRSGVGLVAALLGGAVVGLVAVTQLRPDLVTSLEERVGPALGSERTERPAPPAAAARPR
jgi:hypothetical protein